jgi:hypothetical protein
MYLAMSFLHTIAAPASQSLTAGSNSGQKDQASKSSSLPAVIAMVTTMIMCDGNQSAHGRRRQY